MATCEDYPCCGHTDGLGCDWTYTPEARAFDEQHMMCDHELGYCEAYDDEPDECDGDPDYCPEGGCPNCSEEEHASHFGYGMEDQWLDGSYEE